MNYSGYCWRIFIILGYYFPGPLVKESRLLLGLLFLFLGGGSMLVAISRLSACSFSSLRYRKQNLLPCYFLGLKSLESLFSSLHLLEFSILHIMSRNFILSSRRNREKYVHSIFPEQELKPIFVITLPLEHRKHPKVILQYFDFFKVTFSKWFQKWQNDLLKKEY